MNHVAHAKCGSVTTECVARGDPARDVWITFESEILDRCFRSNSDSGLRILENLDSACAVVLLPKKL